MKLTSGKEVTQMRYLGAAGILGTTYLVSLFDDFKVRVTNGKTGKIVRTFSREDEATGWLNAHRKAA